MHGARPQAVLGGKGVTSVDHTAVVNSTHGRTRRSLGIEFWEGQKKTRTKFSDDLFLVLLKTFFRQLVLIRSNSIRTIVAGKILGIEFKFLFIL